MAKKSSRKKLLRRSCGAMAAHMMLLEKFPSFRASQMRLEGVTARGLESVSDIRKAKLVTIKTVVNVVYRTDEENVGNAQIRSQILALNKDFRATNPDRSKTPLPWKGLVTDAHIKFKLVKTTRTKTTKNGFSFDDGVKKASTGGIAPYKPTSHLNLWVCALTGGLLVFDDLRDDDVLELGDDVPLADAVVVHVDEGEGMELARAEGGGLEVRCGRQDLVLGPGDGGIGELCLFPPDHAVVVAVP